MGHIYSDFITHLEGKIIYSIYLKSCQILMYLCLEMSLAVNRGTTSTAGYTMDQN